MAQYIARRHRYADGCVYNPNQYDLRDATNYRRVGGALVLKGKAIAYVGLPPGDGARAANIIKHASHYVWGATLQEALAKIRPHLTSEDDE